MAIASRRFSLITPGVAASGGARRSVRSIVVLVLVVVLVPTTAGED